MHECDHHVVRKVELVLHRRNKLNIFYMLPMRKTLVVAWRSVTHTQMDKRTAVMRKSARLVIMYTTAVAICRSDNFELYPDCGSQCHVLYARGRATHRHSTAHAYALQQKARIMASSPLCCLKCRS